MLWIICIVVYTAVVANSSLAGGSDLFSMGKGMIATALVAILGRVALGMLEKSRVPVHAAAAQELGSLLDLVSQPHDAAPEETLTVSTPAREPVAVGGR